MAAPRNPDYLYEQLRLLLSRISDAGIEYALCGGLALAAHGIPRATVDIDLLLRPDDWEKLKAAVRPLGYSLDAAPMNFAQGKVQIRRVSKIDPGQEVMTLDALLVTPEMEQIWRTREKISWENGFIWVASRAGLIALKRLSGRPQDLVDIQKLEELDDQS